MKCKLTKLGIRQFPKHPRTGELISFKDSRLKVRPDGRKTASWWHVDFWKPLKP